jgi:hypothetical protein
MLYTLRDEHGRHVANYQDERTAIAAGRTLAYGVTVERVRGSGARGPVIWTHTFDVTA